MNLGKGAAVLFALCVVFTTLVLSFRSSGAAPPSARYRLGVADEGPVSQIVATSGTLQPLRTVSVGTQVSGTVVERLVDFNDPVRKGQVLLRIDPASFEARVRQGRAQVAAAEANLRLAAASDERSRLLYGRGFLSAAATEQSKREFDAARANVDLAQAQLDASEADLRNTVIRSPIDGIVLKRSIDVGQTVAATFQTPDLFQLAQDLSRLELQANVSEADIAPIRRGNSVRFAVDALPDAIFVGTVRQIHANPSSTQGVVNYPVLIDVENRDGRLKPGMTAQCQVIVGLKPRALRIPTAALRFRQPERGPAVHPKAKRVAPGDDGSMGMGVSEPFLFPISIMLPSGEVEVRDVTIGYSNNRLSEVKDGNVKPGDNVVVGKAEEDGDDAP